VGVRVMQLLNSTLASMLADWGSARCEHRDAVKGEALAEQTASKTDETIFHWPHDASSALSSHTIAAAFVQPCSSD
jgi:hypothetical protein